MNNHDPVPARAVRSLLEEILAVLDAPRPDPARVSHVVMALRHLLRGPQMAGGNVDNTSAVLHANLAAVATTAPVAGGIRRTARTIRASRPRPPDVHLARGAESGTLAGRTQFLAESVTDAIDNFAATGAYDRQLAGRLAATLSATDMGVIASWVRRAARDVPDDRPLRQPGPVAAMTALPAGLDAVRTHPPPAQ